MIDVRAWARSRRPVLVTSVVLAGVTVAGLLSLGAAAPADVVIRRATLVDGTGAAGRSADVAVTGGRISAIGAPGTLDGRTTIDAAGLVVAPGFIDVHTHADDIADRPLAENFARMGVTTIVAGNCGSSAVDVRETFARIAASGISINFATLVGHNSVRAAVMGTSRRAPTREELTRMRGLVATAMASGAVGFSTGLQYVPGTYAATDEIVALATEAAKAGGLYATHMRNEGTAIEDAIAEALSVGEHASCPVEISHLKIDSPNRWGRSEAVLRMLHDARARGMDVRADQYLYDAASSGLAIRFPAWIFDGGDAQLHERLDSATTWERIRQEMLQLLAERGLKDLGFARVASYPTDPSLNGLAMDEVAGRLVGDRGVDAQLEAARRMLRTGGASMVYRFMSDEDIDRIAKDPNVSFASDSSVLTQGDGVPHPRGYGNTVRALGVYVRERHVISLEDAVRKMTSLPAASFKLGNRGVVREGAAADLVVFDPRTVGSPATYEAPHAYATGVPFVLVNGVLVVRDGQHTGARPGRVIKRGER